MNELSDAIYNYRVKNQLSQSEFAKLCRVSFVTISNIERKKYKPRKLTEAKIRMVLDTERSKNEFAGENHIL